MVLIRRAYTAALAIGLTATAPVYLSRAVRRGTGVGLRERLGRLPASVVDAVRGRRPVWVHAVSVGEVNAVAPLLRAIKGRYPARCLFVTTVTATGRRTVIERVPEADAVAYFPLDFPNTIERLLDLVDPRLFLSVETELWPNFLFALARRRVPSYLVNARLTERSARRYGWAGWLFRPALAGVSGFAAQTAADADRLAAIGADRSRIIVAGNLKFDQPADDPTVGPSREQLGLQRDDLLWVAGSTHPGEEAQLLAAYRRLRERDPRIVLLLAPRHVDRLEDLESVVRRQGCEPIRRSSLAGVRPACAAERPPVVVLDTMGELAALYGLAALAFVGGTLAPIGGHNLLEPAARGTPVVFGPHTHKCREIATALIAAGGGVQVDSTDALIEVASRLMADPALRERMGRQGRAMVAKNRGAVERTLAMLEPWLAEDGS